MSDNDALRPAAGLPALIEATERELLFRNTIECLAGLILALAVCASLSVAQPITEGFNDINTLVPGGWFMQNNSMPPGTTGWFQGLTTVFSSQAGPANSYIAANFNNTTDQNTISNWLLTPVVALQNGNVLSFWTRTVSSPVFPDRLQVRMSTSGASTNVGSGAFSVGDFTTLLFDINPAYQLDGYPTSWTQFTATLAGLPANATGRFAFRYFVENAGPNGVNSFYIGIDSVNYGNVCQFPLPACNADVSPPGGDHVVNVADLLAVINSWAQTGPPRPMGDCSPLPSGDCLVNSSDLLAVINQWGACPSVAGACCLPNGSCTANQTQTQCAALGGSYQGDGSICGTCIPAPANDECSGAVTVVVGANNGSNAGATTSIGAPDAACATGGPQNFTRDVWFKFTAPSTSLFQFDTCATTGTVTDTTIQVLSGTCGSLTQLACDDNACEPGVLSMATAFLNQGQQVFIRVASWNTSPAGPFVLTISAVAGCGPCTGTPEGFPCVVDGNDPANDPNGGCNSTPPAFPTTISLNQTICGTLSTYVFNGTTFRDTDSYLFTPATGGSYTIHCCAGHSMDCGFLQNTAGNITSCGAGYGFVPPGGVIVPANTETTITRFLTAGKTYAVFCANGTGSGNNPCGGGDDDYRFTVTQP